MNTFKEGHSYLMDRVTDGNSYWKGVLEITVLKITETAIKIKIFGKKKWFSKYDADDTYRWQIREDLGIEKVK